MKRAALAAAVVVALLLGLGAALAQGSYDLAWFTVDGGGGTSSGGPYALSGTFGQPDASALTSGSYTVTGGFWAAASGVRLYLPIVQR